MLRYSKYRDCWCFGGVGEQNSWHQVMHICFLAMISFSHPCGLTGVFMDDLNCSMKAPQRVRKALLVTKPSTDSRTNVMFGGFCLSFFQQLKLGQEEKLFRKKVLCLFKRCVLNPFSSFSREPSGEPVHQPCLYVTAGIFVMPCTSWSYRVSLLQTFTLRIVSCSVWFCMSWVCVLY